MLAPVFRITVSTLALWIVVGVALRVTVIHAEYCPAIEADDAHQAAVAAGDWLVRNQAADGTYVYEYDRRTDEYSSDYNVVRHAGVTMSLYQLVGAGEDSFLPTADEGLALMRANLLEAGDGLAFKQPNGSRVSLGASSLLLAALAQRRIATDDPVHDELMRSVGRFLLELQRPDGSLLAEWDISANAPFPDFTSPFATGEAFWALAMMHRIFPDEGWGESAKAVGIYLSRERDEVEGFSFPPWADQWAAYGFTELVSWELEDREVEYVRSLAERFGFLVRVEARRTGSTFSNALHGRQARAAGLGTWVEALGSLWALSQADPRLGDLTADIGLRGVCAAGMLADRQLAAGNEAAAGDALAGAWFTEGRTRMDDQQHALSGLLLVERILRNEQ